ncbi:protein-tyrosine phosphatase [Cytobacillus horneckiae]|uniref:tyrosine-protein phosphatase n=1 Tax=Cytobacillus horneckiae TaxID=549687 RepID=UPI0019D31487|nr:tyrosine-protein phosphatase [Cytobacillus horneckiae]MBN6885554.1 tyrosine-protein phosphatase [Cytobacillus horneckiae]MCM3180418.1 tyrosine-protein phosphatase [Cytobacillus horneckiae]
MKNAKLHWARLPINSIENCRDLGGYSTEYGQQTKWHSFLRSSDMSRLTHEDIVFLKEYGVKTVIDLRGKDEIETHKNPLAKEAFCEYHNIPFITQQVSDITQSFYEKSMGDFYVDLLEQNDSVKKIFDIIDQANEGCIVFHCQAGKDRTGVLAMLLLGIAGVEKKDIVSNYEVTFTNLESIHQTELPYGMIPKEFLYSNRDYILKAYEYILQNYQSVDQFLVAKDVEQDVINRVKHRFLGLGETVAS